MWTSKQSGQTDSLTLRLVGTGLADVNAGSQEVAFAIVELLTPGGRVWAYASLIDFATGDPTTIPVLVP